MSGSLEQDRRVVAEERFGRLPVRQGGPQAFVWACQGRAYQAMPFVWYGTAHSQSVQHIYGLCSK